MPDKKYLIEIPDMPDGSGVWDADKWERNKDKFMQKYPTANVFELGSYDPEDMDDNDQFMLTFDDDPDASGVWDAAKWERNKEKFVAKYPEAHVNRVRYMDYWGDKAKSDQARIAELQQPDEERNARLAEMGYYDDSAGTQVDYANALGLSPLSSAIEQNSVSGEVTYLDPKVEEFFANDSAYTDRQMELNRLRDEYEANPRVIEQREYEAQMARYAEELEKQIKADMEADVDAYHAGRGAAAKHMQDASGANQTIQAIRMLKGEDVGKDVTENEKQERYASALKLLQQAKDARDVAGKGMAGGVADTAKDWLRNLGTQSDIEMYNEVGNILTALEQKVGNLNEVSDEVIEENLTNDEKALIRAFFEYNAAMADAGEDMSIWYKGGKIFAESIPFMMEFLVTGGLANSAGRAATSWMGKGFAKWIANSAKGTAARAAKKVAAKTVSGVAKTIVAAGARTLVAPTTYKNIAEQSVQYGEDGHLDRDGNMVKAAVDSYIEQLSEMSGAAFGKVLGGVGRLALGKTAFEKVGAWFGNNAVMQNLSKLGFHGLPEEVGEEIFGNALRTITGVDEEALSRMFEKDEFASMIIGFAPMTLLGAGMSMAKMGAVSIGAANAGRRMRQDLSRSYTEEQIDQVEMALDEAKDANEISNAIRPIIMGMKAAGAPMHEIQSVWDYAIAVAKKKAMVSAQSTQEMQLAQAKIDEAQERMGGRFWIENKDGVKSVKQVVLNNGNTAYVVSEPDQDGRVAIINAVTGQKGTALPGDIKEESWNGTLNAFGTGLVMADRTQREQQRMQEERTAQVNEVRNRLGADPRINVGTEGSPVYVVAQSFNDAGVRYVAQDGSVGNMSWEQAADSIGMPIVVKTDAQIAQEEAEALVAAAAERRAKRAKRDAVGATERDNAVVDAENAVEGANEAAKHIPMNDDGTVNEAAFWEQSPEEYVKWNDEQNHDGGQDSLQQVAIAKQELMGLLQEANAAQNTSNPTTRKAAKKGVERLADRIARLDAIEQSYAQALEEEQAAVQQTAATPTSSMSEEDLESMDAQYQGILGKTRVQGERVRVMQEYLDKISEESFPVVVLTRANYAEKMKAEGCEESRIKIVERYIKLGKPIGGFTSNGKLFLMEEGLPNINEARVTYVHERQHVLNTQNPKFAQAIVEAAGGNREMLVEWVKSFVGNEMDAYKSLTPEGLADELICRCMEIAYTSEEFSVDLQSKGIPSEVISIITEIDNEQRSSTSLANARRRGRRNENANVNIEGGVEENGRDSGQVSGGILGNEAVGSSGSSNGGAQTGSAGEGGEVISEEQLNAPNSGEASQITAADGEVIADTDGNGKVRFSIRTWLEGGRDYLAAWLAKDTTLADDEKADILARMDEFYQNASLYSDTYVPFGTWSEAGVRYDGNGNPLMSVIKANGDYAMNLDFSLVCKKRRPLNRLLRTLVNRNAFSSYTLRERELAEINWILQEHGFEVACALCFVDSKRYRVTGVADVFASLYNSLVKSIAPKGVKIGHFNYSNNPNVEKVEDGLDTLLDEQLNWAGLDKALKGKKEGSVEYKVAQYLREHPEARRLVDATDFIEAEGFESVKENNPDLLKFYNMKKGTGGPKASFGDVQYLNDILKNERTFSPEKAYAVGGVRLQSFSDFVPHMYFDYMQLFAELAAKKLPVHAYTKEVLFAKIFGLTGAKINLSLVPAVVEGGVAPGLDAEGNYAWADPIRDTEDNIIQQGQTFPFDEAMAIQNAEGYSKNCGAIAVGISDAHIEKMLDDPNIQFIIPYHKSSLNAIVARMTNIDKYKDYTNVQNTRKATGSKLDKGTKDFNFNEHLHNLGESGTPQQAAQAYLDWCRENGFVPKFSQFAYHPNYYKLLVDFNTIDTTTGEYAPQGAVSMTFPTEQSAFGNVETLIQQGLQEDAELEEKLEAEINSIADQVLARLAEIAKEPKMTEKQQARKMAEVADERMARIRERASGTIDILEEARRVVEREDGVAFRVISDENYEMAQRIISNLAGRPYFQRVEGEYELGKLASNYAELADIIMAIDANGNYTPVGTALLGFFAENPDMHFPLLFNDSAVGKETSKAFAEELSKVNDPFALYFMKEAWKIHKGSLEQAGLGVKPSSTTKYNKAIDARAEEIKAAEVKGTAFNFKKQESSLDEIDAIFKQLNKDEDLALLHDRVMNVARTLGVKVSFAGKRGNTAGESLGDKVSYDYKFFNSPAVSDQKKCNTITHELIHSVTVYAIYLRSKAPSVLSDGMLEAVDILHDVYNQIARDPAFKGEYGVTDVYEMVAELSNAQFRDKLKEKNLFQRILDALKRLLGIDTVKEDSAYQVLSDTLNYIIDNYDQAAFDAYALYASKSKSYGRMMKIEEAPRFRITPEQDKAYMDAVEAGDMETAQRMVDETAKLAMPNTKVVDENGNPKVVYHGTNKDFTAFENSTGRRFVMGEPYEVTSEGYFFAPTEKEAEKYGKRIVPAYVNIENPLDLTTTDAATLYESITGYKFYPEMGGIDTLWDMMDEEGIAEKIRSAGYDGVIFAESLNNEGEVNETSFAAIFPSQIKSAEPVTYDNDGNVIPLSERFNKENPDIRFRVRSEEEREKLFEDAKAHYGVTQNFNAAGYMLPDGSLLDFSEANDGGDPNSRSLDHRDIEGVIMDNGVEYDSRWMYIADFMNEGAIRLLPESAGINMIQAPTEEQRKKIFDFIYKYNGEVILEINDERLNSVAYMEYNRRTSPSRIFRDIDGYFNDGIVPQQDVRFRMSNENQAIFVSNAARAVEGIKQEKATPEQWLKMIEKNGGLKAGEDKWMGLSDWLKASDKKTLTKQEVLDFINENMIVIEEQHYSNEEVAASANKELNDKYPGWDEAFSMEWDGYMDEPYASVWDAEIAVELYNDYHEDQIELDEDGEFQNMEDEDKVAAFGKEIAEIYYRGNSDVRPIHGTRSDYQTRGLSDNHEIALTVPTIESWKADDAVHFGDAGDGRAIAWIRFGETKYRPAGIADEIATLDKAILDYEGETSDEEYKALVDKKHALLRASRAQKVLVIDEIQSKRHQEGRERGYMPNLDKEYEKKEAIFLEAQDAYINYLKENYNVSLGTASQSEVESLRAKDAKLQDLWEVMQDANGDLKDVGRRQALQLSDSRSVPDAPFDKNWHELAMKRMLRYAAENGYDVIAWTKGDQQAERYNIGNVVEHIDVAPYEAENSSEVNGFDVSIATGGVSTLDLYVTESGEITSGQYGPEDLVGKQLSDVVGKDLAAKILSTDRSENSVRYEGEDFRIGGEGMKGFYDKMLPAFMNKYGKRWGVKVEDIDLSNLEDGLTMHSVPVTEEMKASVMEGQVMFRVRGENESAEEFVNGVIGDFKSRYTAFNDIVALDPTSKEQLADFIGMPVDKLSDEMMADLMDRIEERDSRAWFNPDTKRIAIFVRENVRDGKKSELVLIHENIHAINKKHNELIAIGEYLWNSAKEGTREYRYKTAITEAYPESEWFDEMSAYVVSEYIQDGEIDVLKGLLDAESTELLDKLLKYNGNGKERARQRPRISWNVLRERPSDKSEESRDEGGEGQSGDLRFRATEITPEVRDEMDVIAATAIVNGNYRKAPNGKDSNLTAEQWAMVRTKGFKAWFGDWENDPGNASKVVDENGEPKVVFHGGAWRPLLEEKGNAVFKMRGGLMGKGAYFTDMLSTAIDYAREKYGWEHDEEVSDEFLDDNGYITEVFLNIRNEDNIREYYGETYYLATNPSQIKSATDNNGEFSEKNDDIRFRMTDSNGNTLTAEQERFLANSKAVDKDGNLLVLYHGTPRAGFTEFKSGFFTTSKEDAISYSGDRKGRSFDPNEKYEPETLTAGDFRLGYMTFDSEEDRAAFLERFPYANEVMSEEEYESARLGADEEYDALTARRKEFAEVWNAYREYERERFVDTTIGDLIANPEAYTEEDLRRAMLAYNSNASFDNLDDMDATERKDALVSALQNANEETEGGILDMAVATRVPRNGEGQKHNDLGNRTYEVYANIERPYEIDANGRGSEFESGDIYKAVEEALADEQYDGVIIRNWRVGRYQNLGDVVVPKNGSQIKLTGNEAPDWTEDIRFSIRTKPAPKKTGKGYKVFYLKDGKLYPPMVANQGGVDTPVGVWLDAEEGTRAGESKTGRPQVKQGGKGTQGGSGTLAYRPGWHLGEIPYAIQFNRKDENGDRTLFPADFVWAEVEYANDVDYQEEAMSYGMNANGKFQHSLAGLPKLPTDGSYRYRTNPNPETDPWIITGAMKVNRLLTPSEVDQMVVDAGREPQKRQEGAVTDAQIEALNKELGLEETVSFRFSSSTADEIDIKAMRGISTLRAFNVSFSEMRKIFYDVAEETEKVIMQLRAKQNRTAYENEKLAREEKELRAIHRRIDWWESVNSQLVSTDTEPIVLKDGDFDLEPRTPAEFISKFLTMSMTRVNKQFIDKEGKAGIKKVNKRAGVMLTQDTLRRELGWNEKDWSGFRYILSESEGKSLDEIAEMISEDSDAQSIFVGMDVMDIKNEIIDFLQSVRSYADIRDYIKNERTREAKEERDYLDGLVEATIEQIESSTGMTIDEYNDRIITEELKDIERILRDVETSEIYGKFEDLTDQENEAYQRSLLEGAEGGIQEGDQAVPDLGDGAMDSAAAENSEPQGDSRGADTGDVGDRADESGGSRIPPIGNKRKGLVQEPMELSSESASVDEVVNKGRQKAINENVQANDIFSEKVQRLNNSLAKLRSALAAQREYDVNTVKIITALANELLQIGRLTDMSRSEIKRLLSVIKDATGKEDLSIAVERLMDIMIANQLRSGKSKISELTKIKASKVNASGVEVRGSLDVAGQQMLQTFKDSIAPTMTDETLAENIAIEESNLDSDSDVIRKNAENRLAGYYLAQQYRENILASEAEEKSIREEIKRAKEQHDAGLMDKDAFKEFVKSCYDAIRENRMERVTAYEKLANQLAAKLAGSILNAKLLKDAEKARIEQIHHFANSDMQGMPSVQQGEVKKGIWNNTILRFLFKPLATFDQMLRSFAPKSRNGEGYLWNHFMGGWLRSSENEFKGIQAAHEQLDAKVRSMFAGVKRWSDLFSIEKKLPTMEVKFWDGEKMADFTLTQGNLLYIYMVNKMTDGKMKLRKMGITEEDVNNIARELDPRFIELADWIQDTFLPGLREKYNTLHEKMFGAPMAAIDNYFPIRVLANARTREVDIAVEESSARPSTITGSIIKRTKNSLALDILGSDAFDVVLEHIEQMEHWAAFAEFNRDLNTLLSYRKFRNRVQNMRGIYGAGATAWNNFRSVAEIAAGVYKPAVKGDSLDKLITNIAKGVTGAKISFRVYTALKQFLSAPAFVSDASAAALIKSLANPYKAWTWAMKELPLFEKRWKSRQAGDSRLMETESDWKLWKNKIVELAGRYGMTPNAFVDALTVSIGARAIYETKRKEYVKLGYTQDQAEEKAKRDATVLFNESQQSNESAFLSAAQVDRTVASVLITVFRNSSMGYQRMYVDALRNIKHMLKKGYKAESLEYMKKQMMRDGLTEDQAERAANRIYNKSFARSATRLATFGFLVQFAWNLGPYMAYLLMGDDDDEKKDMIKDAAVRGLVGGPVEGLAAGQAISGVLGDFAMSEEISDPMLKLPATSDMESIFRQLEVDPVRAVNDIFNLVIQSGIGVNPQTITDAVVAIIDGCNGDLETSKEAAFALMRILQTPQSQIEKLYMEEIDFTAEEALDMSVREFAERYAKYKVMRTAPLAKWMYSDEKEKELEDKYIKTFTKKASEMERTHGTEEAQEFFEYYDSEYEETAETLRDLKKQLKEAILDSDTEREAKANEDLDNFLESEEFKRFEELLPHIKAYEAYRKALKTIDDPKTRSEYAEKMIQERNAAVEILREE